MAGNQDRELDILKGLFDRFRDAADSDRQNTDGAFNIFLGASYFSRALNVDMQCYYFDPVLYLSTNLRIDLLKHEVFLDDAPCSKVIPWNPGVTFEPSLFGVKAVRQSDKEAWETHEELLIEEYSDLNRLAMPDFYDNEAMLHTHDMYDRLREITEKIAPDFTVAFPRWRRSPFGNACSLRGMERLCFDFFDNPSFVHKLMAFVTDSRICWETSCDKFLSESSGYILANDEVNCPTISPALYTEFILPYEKRLLEHYGGELDYFHSCGNLTPLISYIKTLEPKLFQVSPWTDLDTAITAFAGTDTVLDIWVHTADDVMRATKEHAAQTMKRLYDICRCSDIAGFQFNSGNIQRTFDTVAKDDAQISQWAYACLEAKGGIRQC